MLRPLPHPGLQTPFYKAAEGLQEGSGEEATPCGPTVDESRRLEARTADVGRQGSGTFTYRGNASRTRSCCQKDRATDMSQGSGNTELKEGFQKHGLGRSSAGDSAGDAVVEPDSLATYAGYVKVWCVGQLVRPFPSRTRLKPKCRLTQASGPLASSD